MTDPAVPSDEELRSVLASALPEALGPAGLRRRAIPSLGVESSVTGFGIMVLDALLPVVRRYADQRAAEELRRMASLVAANHGTASGTAKRIHHYADALTREATT